ncbi:MAG: GNAT family N-acetyltransferase [Candidatus Saccharibacteria bacterium]|nr:GNAT family N-acetyltransferase [Candidatus Saccharibacteria bacterium]
MTSSCVIEDLSIEMLRKKDYASVINYAIVGMHFDWYMSSKMVLKAYGKYFLYTELNRATQVIAAYKGDELAGVLLAEIKGEKPVHYSFFRHIYVRVFDVLQHLFAGGAVGAYDKANMKMLADYKKKAEVDGELIFLAANPDMRGKGVGTILLEELIRREPGKRIYLFTDSACTYQFYDNRGFDRVGERHVVLKLKRKRVPLDCYLYSRKL